MNEKFLEVGDVMQILGISRSAAYKLMRQINSELEKKGSRHHTIMKVMDNSLHLCVLEMKVFQQHLYS